MIIERVSFSMSHGKFGRIPDPPEVPECEGACETCKYYEVDAHGTPMCTGNGYEENVVSETTKEGL